MPSTRILAATSLLVVLVAPMPAGASTCPLTGDGTSGTPYLVTSAADLAKVASVADSCATDAAYRQTVDITLTGSWTPISGPFTGTYDGAGFTISGLTVSRPASTDNGLFGMAGPRAVLRDVHLVDVSITGGQYTGALVGSLGSGSVIDSSAQGTVTSNDSHTGGLVGYGNGATVSGSRFTGTVTSTSGDYIGGLIGDIGSGVMDDSTVEADVSSAGSYTGGLVGIGSGPVVSRSRFVGTVTSTAGRFVGGIVGDVGSGGEITDASAEGDVTAAGNYVGGVVGYGPAGATIARARFAGTVTTSGEYVGGLVGAWELNSSVSDSSARGRVETSAASRFIGGLIGYAHTATLTRSYSTGVVAPATGSTFVGGFVGEGLPTSTMETFWDTETSGQATSAAGVGATTAQLTSLASFLSWPIVDGWAPADVGANRVWGICPRVNDGYPFLLWEYSSDPCVEPVSAAAPSIAIACTGPDGGTLRAGAVASCVLSGADPGIDILWRAAYNPAFAEGPVRTGVDGRGTFTFTIPAAAAGSVLTVEPVAWTAPIVVGTVEGDTAGGAGAGGPVPARIPAGGGSGVFGGVSATILMIAVLAGLVVLAARGRRVGRQTR